MLAALLALTLASHAPLEKIGPYVVVEQVYVNGTGPYRFLLDTGAQSCAVSPRVARALGIEASYRVELVRISGPVRLVGATTVAGIRVGGIERADVEVLLGSMDAVHQLDPELDGIVGQSFLRGLGSYLIDYRESRLVLEPPAPPVGGRTHSFEFQNDCPRVPIQKGGTQRDWILDSGAPRAMALRGRRQPGLLATSSFDSVYVNNRERFVVLQGRR